MSELLDFMHKELRKMDEYSARQWTEPPKVIISEHLEEYYKEVYGEHFFDHVEIVRPQRISKFAEFVFNTDIKTED